VTHGESCEEVMHRENLEEIGQDYTIKFLFKYFAEDEYNRAREYVYEAKY
jgi:ADP-ribose pyrophosphatase YjhB (NUDIX family)